jgi:hypothetical protein
MQKIKHYKNLQILNQLHVDSAGWTLPWWFVIVGCLWVLCVVGTIKLYGVVKLMDYLILCNGSVSGGIVLFAIIHFCGNIPKAGSELVDDLRDSDMKRRISSPGYRRILQKYTKSMEPFGVQNGPVRILKHAAIYVYFEALIDYVVTMLLADWEI